MTWPDVAIIAVGAFQVVALAWLAGWQQRAAQQVRVANGRVEGRLTEIQAAVGRPSSDPR